MLSGISQKHNMRSSSCRFTESCNSQCLSHFAAPFIVVRTETSIAESCEVERLTAQEKKCIQTSLCDSSPKEATAARTRQSRSLTRPTARESQHEGSKKHILTQTLTEEFTWVCLEHVRMILPQVHLRKPCYDFSFL
jgi:hypothetical protein